MSLIGREVYESAPLLRLLDRAGTARCLEVRERGDPVGLLTAPDVDEWDDLADDRVH